MLFRVRYSSCCTCTKMRNEYKVFVGKPQGLSHCCKDNIKTYVRGVSFEDWVHLLKMGISGELF